MNKPKIEKLSVEELERLWLLFQRNVYPHMVEDLAEELKPVSVASIKRLGVGYDFLTNAWIFAERDERGQIVGLSTRGHNGSKLMVPGSRRGLIYECIEVQAKGEKYHNSGFIPCRHVKVDCPKCGEQKWCMVSCDDPNDPSAVICGRTSDGAVKHIKGSGYLHRLKPTKQQGSVLPDSDKRYIVVEGASDVLAMMELKYVGIGRPSAETGVNLVAALLKNKAVVVMGENDGGAGVRGMDKAFTQCKSGCKDLLKCLPPVNHKDMRHWVASGLTAAEFESWIRQNGVNFDSSRLLDEPPKNFSALVERFATEKGYAPNGAHRVIYHHGNWFIYTDGKYEPLNPEFLEAELRAYYNGFEYICDDLNQTIKPVQIDTRFQAELKRALRDYVMTKIPDNVTDPCILSSGKAFDCSRTIMFKNGMLDVTSGRLIPHDNNIFTTLTLPYNYDPHAVCNRWNTVVQEWLDEDEIELLQEWFGYNMVMTNDLQQIMFIYGNSGSGKSVATHTLKQMLGGKITGNYETTNALLLANDKFATFPLIGKLAMFIHDQNELTSKTGKKVWETLKQISGQDDLPTRNMHKVAEGIELLCRITYTSNSLTVVLDETGSIFRRHNIIHFQHDFNDNPNRTLRQELKLECPGIAIWAIEGLKRLLKNNGKFTIPAHSAAITEELKEESRPLRQMLTEYFTYDDPTAFTPREIIRDLYNKHCIEDNVKYQLSKRSIIRHCYDALPELRDLEHARVGIRGYLGMKITKEGANLIIGS